MSDPGKYHRDRVEREKQDPEFRAAYEDARRRPSTRTAEPRTFPGCYDKCYEHNRDCTCKALTRTAEPRIIRDALVRQARRLRPRTADDVLNEDYTYVEPRYAAAFREGWKAREAEVAALDVATLALALYEADEPEQWMRTSTEEYQNRAHRIIEALPIARRRLLQGTEDPTDEAEAAAPAGSLDVNVLAEAIRSAWDWSGPRADAMRREVAEAVAAAYARLRGS